MKSRSLRKTSRHVVEVIDMQNIKCKNGKCWDEDSAKNKIRTNCEDGDIVCETEAELLEDEIGDE